MNDGSRQPTAAGARGVDALTGVFAVLYAALLALVVWIRPFTWVLLAHLAWLAAYLSVCLARGNAARRGVARGSPVVDTLLWLCPPAVVLACTFVTEPRPLLLLATLASVPLAALASLLLRRRRGRRRPLEASCLLVAPLVTATLLFGLWRGFGGGVYLVLTSWLEYAFGYAAAGVPWATPAAVAGALLWLGLAKAGLRKPWPEALFGAGVVVYGLGAYLLFGVYYAPPLAHGSGAVALQPHTEILPFPSERGPGRALWVDAAEEHLVLSVKSTYMGARPEASGLLTYDLIEKKERSFVPMPAPCIEMIVDPEQGVVHSCEFFTRSLRDYALPSLELMEERILPAHTRPEALVRLDDRFDMIRYEVPGPAPPLARLDRETGAIDPVRVPERWGMVGSYQFSLAAERRKIFFPMGAPDETVLHRLDWQGRFEDAVALPGTSFEAHYSAYHDAVFVALLTRDLLYRVEPDTLRFTATPFPRGARAVRETDGGILILGDYLRGKVYLYDPAQERIRHTLLVGAKPQALFVARPSGNLYVHSSFGLIRFDLPAILSGLR